MPVRPALPGILQPLCQMPVDSSLGREGDFPAFHGRFQEISNLNVRQFADMNVSIAVEGGRTHRAFPAEEGRE